MIVEYDGIIFTDNVQKYLQKEQPRNIKIIKYYPVRKITVIEAEYHDKSKVIISNIKAIAGKKSELLGVMKVVESLGMQPVTDPFSFGEMLNNSEIPLQEEGKRYKEIYYKTENKAYYKNEKVFEWFKEELHWVNPEKVKINENIILIDINSMGAGILLKTINNNEIEPIITMLHNLKLENEDDEVLRKFFKYSLIGYVNSFLFQSKFNLIKVKDIKHPELYIEDPFTDMLIVNNSLYYIKETRIYTQLADKYYSTYINTLKHYEAQYKPLMVFGDNFYVKESITKNINFSTKIGEFRKGEELELLSGDKIPGLVYFVSKSEHPIVGCYNGKMYGKVGGEYYKIWSFVMELC